MNAAPEPRISPLELFFDLVFVFAITQVTGLMADDPTWGGIGRGMLVLAAIWWAWAAYAWLTNTLELERDDSARLSMIAVMAAMLVAALATPGAFGDDALVFGLAYFVARAMHIVLYAQGSPDVGVRTAVRRLTPTAVGAPALLILASAFDGAAQAGLWALALAIDYAGPVIRGPEGWRVRPAHFASASD